MLNTKYYKDLNHNYLIIKGTHNQEESDYQHKMITSNRMKHFLECKIRYVDEETHFYYEISSKQSLNSLFADKKIEYEQMRRLFGHMQEALWELENYMLDSRRLILHPDYIYAEPESGDFYFLYYPEDTEMEEIMTYMSLAQFLVDKTEHEQEKALEIAYKVYEMVQDGQFVLSDVMDLFAKMEMEEADPCAEVYAVKRNMEGEYRQETIPVPDMENDGDEKEREREDTGIQGIAADTHIFAAGILMCICLAAAAGIFCLRCLMQLSAEENLFAVVGMGILTVVSAFLLLYLIFHLWLHKSGKHEEGEMVNMFAAAAPDIYEMRESDQGQTYAADGGRQSTQTSHKENGEEYGNTVFLEASMMHKENKLYGVNKGNKYHIDLNCLPCTIGKMAGGVDVVIKDSTISRMHARFTRQENGICVTDLNSTNGSFKNGLRLEPNETVLIEPGDELRFGRMTFCYR